MSKIGKTQRGFTLLELLVAMTVLSLIAMTMFGGLKVGEQAWERGVAESDEAETVAVVQNLLRRQFSAIYPLWTTDVPGHPHIVFRGEIGTITFLAPTPMQMGPGGNQQFDLHLSPNGELSLDWRTVELESDPSSAVLLRDVASIAFGYFGPPPGSRVGQWSDNWVDRSRLPQLIRLHVTFRPEDKRYWPDLVVHPEIVADVGCVYEPISRNCRGRPE